MRWMTGRHCRWAPWLEASHGGLWGERPRVVTPTQEVSLAANGIEDFGLLC